WRAKHYSKSDGYGSTSFGREIVCESYKPVPGGNLVLQFETGSSDWGCDPIHPASRSRGVAGNDSRPTPGGSADVQPDVLTTRCVASCRGVHHVRDPWNLV